MVFPLLSCVLSPNFFAQIFPLVEDFLNLISIHTFRMSPANFFALNMRKLVKPTESDEKISFAPFTFEVQILHLLRNVHSAKPITWSFHSDQKNFTSLIGHKKKTLVLFSKQELTGFRLVFVYDCSSLQ